MRPKYLHIFMPRGHTINHSDQAYVLDTGAAAPPGSSMVVLLGMLGLMVGKGVTELGSYTVVQGDDPPHLQ